MDQGIRRVTAKAVVPVVAALALLVVGGRGAVHAGEGLAYATGLAGTRGVLVAERCLRTDPDRPAAGPTGDCRGTFLPDDGGPANEHARTDWLIDTQRRVPVFCAADGECRLSGTGGVLYWLSLSLLALAALPVAGFVTVQGLLRDRDRSQRKRVVLGVTTAVLLTCALATFAGAVAAR
ncbi:hypothetical protein GCM10009639_03180 [Kitasatospora putterlickiae]|uniref:Integral membrane protein n=1 Tax=Kitasatospora putterlickiae TaxID=221725 RepID=A0ABN1XJF9_9ACTN